MNAAQLPLSIARCDPTFSCPQKRTCARYLAWLTDDGEVEEIDASLTLQACGCELFIDQRGVALLAGLTAPDTGRMAAA